MSAYEMRISDWSSDVCSSDLRVISGRGGTGMDFDQSQKVKKLVTQLDAFMEEHIYPIEAEEHWWNAAEANRWKPWPGIEPLKEKAREQGLWNLFLPHEYGAFSPGLTNLEYAPLAEIMGRVHFSPEIFNCAAPDTGNMEVLAK